MLVNETYYNGESISDVIRIQFHRIQYFSIWSPGFLLSSPGLSNASPSTSPGFLRVRVRSAFRSMPHSLIRSMKHLNVNVLHFQL